MRLHHIPSHIRWTFLVTSIALLGGSLWYGIALWTQPPALPRFSAIPELHGTSSPTPTLRSTTPEVTGLTTSLYASYSVQRVVARNIVREGSTRATTLGLFASTHVGFGRHITGKEPGILGGNQGVQTSTTIADEPLIDQHLIIQRIHTLSLILPVLEVDVTSMLASSADRFTTLMDHIRVLEDAQTQLKEGIIILEAQIRGMQGDLNTLKGLKEDADKQFFEHTRKLLPQPAYDALDASITLKERIAKQEAQVAALQTILRYYKLLEERVGIKYTALRANQEALIKGVQVVEIKDMQLNLILTERDWRSISGISN